MSTCHALLLALLTAGTLPAVDSRQAVDVWNSGAALSFEPNQGQTHSAVRYLAHSSAGLLFFTDEGVVLAAKDRSAVFELAGGKRDAKWEPLDPTGNTTSYYIGRDRSHWAEGVKSYRRIVRRQVYPGIDVIYYGKGNRLEYDFRVAPHADPDGIRLRFPGAKSVVVDADGALVLQMAEGVVRHERPKLVEVLPDGRERPVAGEYRVDGDGEATFHVGPHDAALELRIDPVLDSSAFVGGSGDDLVLAVNSSSKVGNTTSIDFPGAGFGRRKGMNVFVQYGSQTSIFGATGNMVATASSLAGYLGSGTSIAVAGYTDATDLPTTVSSSSPYNLQQQAWQSDYAGGATDGFLLIITLPGSYNYTFLSYVGTPGDDRITALAYNGASFIIAGTTTGRGLPATSAPVYLGVAAESASGTDGFLITGYTQGSLETLYNTNYFGGSGDDTPLAAYFSSDGCFIAGETTSPDFPVTAGHASTLNGASDAFLARFPYSWSNTTQPYAAMLFGGSGTDRGIALTGLYDGTILLAGQTSSTDLPLQNPAQPAYGGGASDGFLAMFPPDLSALKYATYIGGSGADQPSSIATDAVNNIYVGGWTASTDLPLMSPLQAQYGGGPDDGFLAQYDLAGKLQMATYYGGSGSDHILGLYAPTLSYVLYCGQTTSADLPLRGSGPTNLGGASDGFVARIGTSGIVTGPLVGGKNVRVQGNVLLGNLAASATASISISTSDPSMVQLAANTTDTGQSTIQLQFNGSGQNFYFDCLRDSGSASLTFSAVGYPDLVAPVTCTVPGFSMTHQISGGAASSTATTLVGLNSTYTVYFSLYIPGSNVGYVAAVRPGAAIQVQIANSNSAVGSATPSTVTLSADTTSSKTVFTSAAVGETLLTFSSPDATFPTNSTADLIVANMTGIYSTYTVPSGFQSQISFLFNPLDSTKVLTVTSQDPSSLLLGTNMDVAGVASLTMKGGGSYGSSVLVRAIAPSGDIGVTFSLPGQDPITTTVHITSPTILFPYQSAPMSQPAVLGVGQSLTLNAAFGGANPKVTCCFYPNPGTTAAFSLTSSNPQAVTITPQPLTGYPYSTFKVTGAAAGSTNLGVQLPNGTALSVDSRNVAIAVKNRPVAMSDVEVGKNLATLMTLKVAVAPGSNTAVHLVSSDPTLVLLSPNTTTAGQAQLDATLGASYTSVQFYVYGMASSGKATVTATLAGGGSAAATVSLDPSGFGWSADSISTVLYSNAVTLPSIVAYALDSTTMLPVASQSVQPGIKATVTLTNANPELFTLSNSSYEAPSGASGSATTVASGTGTVLLSVPPGFSQPALRQALTLTITSPTIAMQTSSLGYNLQGSLNFTTLPSVDLPLTVTSSDPSKLLISADPNSVGSASVTVNQSGRNKLTLQALGSSGTVTITASMPTCNPGTQNVTLYPTGIGLSTSNGYQPSSIVSSNGQYTSTTQSAASPLTPVVYIVQPNQTPTQASSQNMTLRAGIGALQVSVTSSNPAAGSITGSPVTLTNPSSQTTVTFTPVGNGETDITVSQPPGFAPVPGLSTLPITVTQPNFTAQSMILGLDTFFADSVSLASNVTAPLANVNVTLTSSDPSRVLLSPDAGTAPTASITQILIAGHNNFGPFYIHALGNSGTVPITLTATGYAPATMDIALGDLSFSITAPYMSSQVLLQNGAQTMTVAPAVVTPSGLTGTFNYPNPVIRPGASIAIGISTSDPSTLSLPASQTVFTGGMSQATATYNPLQTGSATLSITIPAPYKTPSSGTQVQVTVAPAPLYISVPNLLGRDLQYSGYANVSTTTRPSAVTFSSSDPTRLLVSADGKSVGQASLAVAPNTSGSFVFYVQGLADNGNVTVSASAPGYQTSTATVALGPSAAAFGNSYYSGSSNISLFTNSGPQQEPMNLVVLDPLTLQSRYNQLPRPGATISVAATSSDPTVLAVKTPSVTFSVPDPTNPPQFNVTVQPVGAGTAVLSLGPLASGVTPQSGSALVFNLTEPSLNIPSFTLGRDLAAPLQVKLGSSVPTPTANMTVALSSYFPLYFSTTATGTGQYSLNVTIPAGQRTSAPFYAVGMQTLSSATIGLASGNYSSQANATVSQTAFVFKEAAQTQSVSVNGGAPATFTILPALSPLATPVLTPLTIRGGATPIVVNVTSSNPAVLTVVTPKVTFNPGDQSATITVKGQMLGQATLTLSGSTYDFGTVQSSLQVTVH